ncbi:MAG: hypothetical protein ACTSRP_20955 [Candidatus Helarchaeota archaeon]
MLGNLTDEEANELITIVSENVRKNMMGRSVVESKLFPVSHYIHTATYILYDQSYQYNIIKRLMEKIKPKEIGRHSKSLGAPLNQLALNSFAMLYLHGRAQVIHDNLRKKSKGDTSVVVEPEEKKKETKFLLDVWRKMIPSYRNDGALTAENKKIQVLSNDDIENLKSDMIKIDSTNSHLMKKLKRTMAELTIYNFIFQGECRAGIISTISPIPNVIFGMTIDHNYINKLEFNDWGTLFTDPPDFSDHITSLGIWTKELLHPKDYRYPDKLGNLTALKPEIMNDLSNFSTRATKEMYILFSKMNYIEKLMLGTNLYTNFLALFTIYAGIENEFSWTWPYEYARGEPFTTDLLDKDKITYYIKKLEKFPNGAHPFLARLFRRKKIHKIDPIYYHLQD